MYLTIRMLYRPLHLAMDLHPVGTVNILPRDTMSWYNPRYNPLADGGIPTHDTNVFPFLSIVPLLHGLPSSKAKYIATYQASSYRNMTRIVLLDRRLQVVAEARFGLHQCVQPRIVRYDPNHWDSSAGHHRENVFLLFDAVSRDPLHDSWYLPFQQC